MTTKEKIRDLLVKYNELSIKEITQQLAVSKQMAHTAINQLLEEGRVEKLGRPPKTVYRQKGKSEDGKQPEAIPGISPEQEEFLKKNFLIVTETGTLLN